MLFSEEGEILGSRTEKRILFISKFFNFFHLMYFEYSNTLQNAINRGN
jgi:hypothetical protein